MREHKRMFDACLLSVMLLACCALAQAQVMRTWVSGAGNDANPCSRTAPCLTFAGALPKTAEGGEIDALDAADYGSVTITKSATIDGNNFGYVLVNPNSVGIKVDVCNGCGLNHPNDAVVTIRNLSILGPRQTIPIGGSSGGAIQIVRASQVHVEHCLMQNLGGGLSVFTGNEVISFWVKDSTITSVDQGIGTVANGPFIIANIDNLRIEGGGDGIHLADSYGTIRNSYISGMTGETGALVATNSQINAENNILVNNKVAVRVQSDGRIRLSNNSIYNNTFAIVYVGNNSRVDSANNNKFAGNAATGVPNGTPILIQ